MTRLISYNPTRDLTRMQDEVDRLFDTFFRNDQQGNLWQPTVDLYETADAYAIELDLPGVRKEDVNVEYEDGTLRIRGERQLLHEEDYTYHRTERRHGRFGRAFNLGTDVEPEGITASFDNGVLTVRAPKVEQKKPVAIKVK